MHTMNFKVRQSFYDGRGPTGVQKAETAVTVHHNSDWSGDAIIQYVDAETEKPIEIKLPGRLLVQLGETVARDALSQHVIAAIENWDGGRPR